MISFEDSQVLLRKEYGKNFSVFVIVDAKEDGVEPYVDFFLKVFKNIYISNSYKNGYEHFKQRKHSYNIVIVHINTQSTEAIEAIRKIRQENEFVSILVFSSDGDETHHKSEHCYCADATLPYPIDEEYTSKFLYRFLKKISDLQDLENYVKTLEHQIEVSAETVTTVKKETKSIDEDVLKNIRYNQPNKIDASTFVSQLDSSIIDRVELFQTEIDKYIIALYDIEELDSRRAIEELQIIIGTLRKFSSIINVLVIFPVIEETFVKLLMFLSALKQEDLESEKNKKQLVESLLGIGKDLETWINTIFIDMQTNDIHYFDASFAENCLGIEMLFREDEFEEDDGELEFF